MAIELRLLPAGVDGEQLHACLAHGQVLLSAVFDNLGKGASGAAVQNLDPMLALQPTTLAVANAAASARALCNFL